MSWGTTSGGNDVATSGWVSAWAITIAYGGTEWPTTGSLGRDFLVGWSYAGGDVVAPSVDLGALHDAQWEAIKVERDRRTQVGGYTVTVSGTPKWFHSDTFSRTQQIGLVMMGASIPPGLLWKTMDGTFVEMTQALAASVFAAAAAQDQATFAAAEAAKAAMTASPAAFDLSAVAWPAIFE